MKELIEKLIEFRDKRGWKQFHSGLALSHKLTVESAEAAELFEWGQEPDAERLEEELGDVLIVCLYICEKYDIDPVDAVVSKIEQNNKKYPEDYKNQEWRTT